MALIVVEGVLLGAALGVGGTAAVLWALNQAPGAIVPGLAIITLRPRVAVLGAAVAPLLGFAAAFMPAWGAYRARVTEMLRTI